MKVVIFILVFVVLFGSLMAFFNFSAIYKGLSYIATFIKDAVDLIVLLFEGIVDIILDNSVLMLIAFLFLLLWLLRVLLMNLFGGKHE